MPGAISAPTTGREREPYRYEAKAESPFIGDAITYSLASGPAGVIVDPRTGVVEWTPAWGQNGSFYITIQARTLNDTYTNQSWIVSIAGFSKIGRSALSTDSLSSVRWPGGPWTGM